MEGGSQSYIVVINKLITSLPLPLFLSQSGVNLSEILDTQLFVQERGHNEEHFVPSWINTTNDSPLLSVGSKHSFQVKKDEALYHTGKSTFRGTTTGMERKSCVKGTE